VALNQALLEQLDAALSGAEDWYVVGARLREATETDGDAREQALPFVFAFGYMLTRDEERRAEQGPFGPMIETDQGQFPPPVSDIEDAQVDAWREAIEALGNPIALARLHDLLWLRRANSERPDLDARAAVDAYREISHNKAWSSIDRVDCLTRALELVVGVRDVERRTAVVDRMVEFAKEDLANEDEGGPGVTLSLLVPLAGLEEPPAQIDELINSAADIYGGDPFIGDTIFDLRAARDPEAADQIRRTQVEAWRGAAGQAEGLVRAMHLQRALEVAKAHGLGDLLEELRRELQEMQPEEFDLKTVSAEVQIPTEKLQNIIDELVGTEGIDDALQNLGALQAPGGTPEQLDQQVAELRESAPLQFLFRKVVLRNDEATTLFIADTPEKHQRWARAQHRANEARFRSLLVANVLDEIPRRHGEASRSQLTELFTTELIDEPTAGRIARAFELYWAREHDDAAHLLASRLESVLRGLAQKVGIPTYTEPSGVKPGHERSLGWILDQLKPVFATALGWHAYLENLLVDPLGLNLRNVIAHGLRDEIDRGDAALLLQAACFLRLVKLSSQEQLGAEPTS